MADLSPVVEAELARLRAENTRLRNLLKMTPEQAAPSAPGQAAFFEVPPGMVHNRSPEAAKVAFFGALFAARTDIYATRWNNCDSSRGWSVFRGDRGVDADLLQVPGFAAGPDPG